MLAQEGELRPQLLDRFGMSVMVGTMVDTKARTQMVLDRLAYEEDPDKVRLHGGDTLSQLTRLHD